MATMRRYILLLTFIWVLAGCGTREPASLADLPTVAQLPTLTSSPTAAEPIGFEPTQVPLPGVQSSPMTHTPISPTPTSTVTPTPTIPITPSATITDTPTLPATATFTITPTPRERSALELLGDLAREATILPPDFTINGTPLPRFPVPAPNSPSAATPTPFGGDFALGSRPDCPQAAPGIFGQVELAALEVRSLVGCYTSEPLTTSGSAYQLYENGFMVWVERPSAAGTIYVFQNGGNYLSYPDTWDASIDPESGDESPPEGLIEPIRGFGKVWRENSIVRSTLGWAVGFELGDVVTTANYQAGLLLDLPQRNEVMVLTDTGTWRGYPRSS